MLGPGPRRGDRADPTPPAAEAPRLVPVRLVTPPASTPVELLLPSGAVLRLTPDTDLL
jgi:hypothetical protein